MGIPPHVCYLSLLICAVHPTSRACVVALPFVSHILVGSTNGDDPIACRITSYCSCLIDVVETGIDGICVYSSVNYNVSLCDIDVLHHKDMKIRPNKEVEVCSFERLEIDFGRIL
jgi:hypothetical protein